MKKQSFLTSKVNRLSWLCLGALLVGFPKQGRAETSVDLGKTDVSGSLRAPEIKVFDSQKNPREYYGTALKKEFHLLEEVLLKPNMPAGSIPAVEKSTGTSKSRPFLKSKEERSSTSALPREALKP